MKRLSYLFLFLFVSFSLFFACSSSGETDSVFSAEFNHVFGQDQNHVVFTNQSTGDYYSLHWNFGNGETESSTNKSETYEIYYPQAGQYTVSLTIKNDAGESSVKTNVIEILEDDPDYNNTMSLVWSDEFNGSTIDMNNWTFETGATGWGNNELQNYTNGENAHIEDGKLIITARKVNDNKVAGSYTSTRMISKGKQEFKYGRMEICAKLPSGTGIWPAVWMLGSNIGQVGWPACGEIDIMEYVGYEPDVIHSTVHTNSGSGINGSGSNKSLETAEEEFHIYGLSWDENEMVFYIDTPGNVTHTYAPITKNNNNWPFNQPMFFILNIAVGGNWGGAQGIDNNIFPQTMEIDYVRIYQKAS